jgi:quercetin dioxygenase-like cupin family protein
MAGRAGLAGLAALLVLPGPASAIPPPQATAYPDPLEAGWKGKRVCVVLKEYERLRTLRCTFPPGWGHERHRHAPHWGYILKGSVMRITTASGTVVRKLRAGDSWWSDGLDWHEGRNIGQTTGVYLIVEPKP